MIVDEPARFTMAELEESSGVTARNIRYYISNGLVSPALGKGSARYFTSQHLLELEFVARQRALHYSLDEIRELLEAVSEPEPEAIGRGEVWERIHLHPTLELSIRGDAPESVRALVDSLRSVSRDWFGDDEPG